MPWSQGPKPSRGGSALAGLWAVFAAVLLPQGVDTRRWEQIGGYSCTIYQIQDL